MLYFKKFPKFVKIFFPESNYRGYTRDFSSSPIALKVKAVNPNSRDGYEIKENEGGIQFTAQVFE